MRANQFQDSMAGLHRDAAEQLNLFKIPCLALSIVPSSAIPHTYNNVLILQRGDGYWNATAMCQANDKRWNNYYRNKETKLFLKALAKDMKMPVARIRATPHLPSPSDLVFSSPACAPAARQSRPASAAGRYRSWRYSLSPSPALPPSLLPLAKTIVAPAGLAPDDEPGCATAAVLAAGGHAVTSSVSSCHHSGRGLAAHSAHRCR